MKLPIYLDSHATTQVDPEVLGAMQPYFTEIFGNASSRNHEFGWRAEAAVEKAREQIAHAVGANEREIIFTSGATESDNLAVFGVAAASEQKGRHIVTTGTEHKAVLDPCACLEQEKNGFRVTYLSPDRFGRISAESVREAIRPDTILVSVMMANNEVGTLNPIAEIGKLCKERGVLFHSDAVQALGKIPIDVEALGVDLLGLSAHKVYGPKGVGALYVRRKNPRVKLMPRILGGGHERGLRSGTLNVPGIVGFGKAAELAVALMPTEAARVRELRERLWDGLQSGLEDVHLNGHPIERLPNNLNVTFDYVTGESVMVGAKEIAMSSGSACSSATLEPSYVLMSMGLSEEQAHSSIRFGLGRFTSVEEIDFTVEKLVATVRRLRDLSPVYQDAKAGQNKNMGGIYDQRH